MQNHTKQDNITVNIIKPDDSVKAVNGKQAGKASKDPFCVYGHKRHAKGSIIEYEDGSKSVCTEDSTWQNLNE